MIDENEVDAKVEQIDRALRSAPDGATLRLGIDLFTALMRKGFVSDLPAAPHDAAPAEVDQTRCRSRNPVANDGGLADDDFRVG